MNFIPPIPNSLEQQWMPFTANRHFKKNPRILTGAQGMYFTTDHGDQVIDGSAGLFCVAAGHGRREIAEAVNEALTTMDYVPPFQFGHPASFEVARRLAAVTPGDLDHIFFANSGSEAVDTALKIALAYHKAKGEGQRLRLVGRERAYHGVNFGGLSVAGMVNNKKAFGLGLPGALHMRHTHLPEHKFTVGQPETGAELADDLQRFVELHGADSIACVIVEPIAGSTGVLVPPKGYLQRLREICDQHGILLIFDEVICGFGRTGNLFGCETFDIKPDIMSVAKQLSSAYMPISAVLVTDQIYQGIADNSAKLGSFGHGYTYSAHPVSAAVALETLKIYEERKIVEHVRAVSPRLLDGLKAFADHPLVGDVRGIGLIAAVELVADKAAKTPFDPVGKVGGYFAARAQDHGVIFRNLGDTIACCPPMIITEAEIDEVLDGFRKALDETAAWVSEQGLAQVA